MITNSNTVLIIADGWTKSLFEECLDSCQLPEIQGELIDKGALYRNVVTVFPSVSLVSHSTLLTGEDPARHKIPGHRWERTLDNEKISYIGLGSKNVNRDLGENITTLFEKYQGQDTVSVQGVVTRGAKHVFRAPTIDSRKLLEYSGRLMTRFKPTVMSIWLPGGDVKSHIYGPRSRQVVDEMKAVSQGMGVFAEVLKKIGLDKETSIIFTSDHGHKEVTNRVNLNKLLSNMGFSVSTNQQSNSDLRVYTNGDASAFIYANKEKVDQESRLSLLEKLVTFEGIDLAFNRIDNEMVHIFSEKGKAVMRKSKDSLVDYEIESGSDPLSLLDKDRKRTIDVSQPTINSSQKYPDIFYQYFSGFVKDRSAEILVTSKPDYHFGIAPRFAWRLGYHRGSHGGPTRDEMVISAIVKNGEIAKSIEKPIRLKDLLSLGISKSN